MTVAPNTIIANCKIYNNQQLLKGIYELSFTTIYDLPSGAAQLKAADSQGMIQIEFGVVGQFVADLGTGLANRAYHPCLGISGIVPVDSQTLLCQLFLGTALVPPKIQIKNFKLIPKQTPVVIHLPNV